MTYRKSLARHLRTAPTDAERRLWSMLRNRKMQGYKFRRQYPLGRFVADFACLEHRLIVEANGGQHAENIKDDERTVYLQRQDWRVLRFWNNDILNNTEAVLTTILATLEGRIDG